MKKTNLALGIIVLLSVGHTATSHAADLLTLTAATATDPTTGFELDVSATETVTGNNEVLTLVGDGVRKETVAILPNQNIYLIQFFAQNPNALVRDPSQTQAVINSLPAAGTKAVRLTYKYPIIPAAKVNSSLSTSLNNNMTTDEQATYLADINALMAVFTTGGFAKGTSSTILGYVKADGTEEIQIEDASGTVTALSSKVAIVPGFTDKVFSIWLGNTSYDNNLNTLKGQLLTAPSLQAKN